LKPALSIGLDISMVSHPFGSLPRIHRWAGLSAVGTAVLFSVANALWALEQPGPGASGPRLLHFYGDLSGRIVAGALLSLISIAMLVVSASALRSVLIELEGDELLASIAFGGTLLAAATGLGAETINMAAALRAGNGRLTASLAQALFDTSYVLGYNGGDRDRVARTRNGYGGTPSQNATAPLACDRRVGAWRHPAHAALAIRARPKPSALTGHGRAAATRLRPTNGCPKGMTTDCIRRRVETSLSGAAIPRCRPLVPTPDPPHSPDISPVGSA